MGAKGGGSGRGAQGGATGGSSARSQATSGGLAQTTTVTEAANTATATQQRDMRSQNEIYMENKRVRNTAMVRAKRAFLKMSSKVSYKVNGKKVDKYKADSFNKVAQKVIKGKTKDQLVKIANQLNTVHNRKIKKSMSTDIIKKIISDSIFTRQRLAADKKSDRAANLLNKSNWGGKNYNRLQGGLAGL